jgi:hypothetical protein
MPSKLILVESKDLTCVFSLPETDSGVVEFLKHFGSLYIGKVHSEFFKTTFRSLKLKILPWFTDLINIEDDGNYRIGHKIDLCHQALESNWRSPCTATVINGDMQWESGLSRILAGGMCWENPWDQHKLLILTPSVQHITGYLDHAVEIKSDSELVGVLGDNGSVKINTSLYIDVNKQLGFRLGAIQKKVTQREYIQDLQSRVDVVRNWITKYPPKSKLELYTDRPDLIKDSIGFWDIQHKGPGPVFLPKASIDSHLWQQSNLFDSQTTDSTHELFVQNSTHVIDVAELLVWMDLSYTSYYTKDWNFVLRRKSNAHRAKLIGLSRDC